MESSGGKNPQTNQTSVCLFVLKSNIVCMKESLLLPKGTQGISKLASSGVAKA